MPIVRPYCLTIAGFDPSGGAGILADIKTFEQFKVQGLAVITANTFQTEDQFKKADWLKKEDIISQLELLLNRYKVKHFKIGLIESAEVLEAVIKLIQSKVEKPTILWDPILSASAGGDWEEKRFDDLIKSAQLENIWITPNQIEFENLNLENKKDNCTIYLKGGHSSDLGKDYLFANGKTYPFNAKVKTTLTKHGTGCIFSAGLLANLSAGRPMIKSCLRAKQYVEARILSNPTLLSYHK
jgi:hydroxymethylpyrimidine/phosphomethylpyrimidine kinase